jgi:hypothetical protein
MTVQEAIETKERLENLEFALRNNLMWKHHEELFAEYFTLEDLCVAIQALEEVEQYRALGTVEELKEAKMKVSVYEQIKCERDIAISQLEEIGISLGQKMDDIKEAREKQIPKKPIIKAEKERPTTHTLGRLLEICCPVCGKRIFAIYETDLERGGGVTREAKGCSRCLQAIDFEGYYYTPKLDKSDEDIEWSEEDV